jgi:hypothetical protein
VSIAHARAIEELRDFFKKLHLPEFRVLYSDQVEDIHLSGPLILLGGPDANAITRRAIESLQSTFRFGDPARHEIVFTDSRLGTVYAPRVDPDGALVMDYGLLVKCRNPFASDHPTNMMICAGSFGYGTWAAVKLTMSKPFLADPEVSRGAPLECLVETFVVGETPQDPTILELRHLPD